MNLSSILTVLISLITGFPQSDRIDDGQWFHVFLDTRTAHAISTGQGITVAIVDSGVDGGHGDLKDAILPGADMTGPGDGRTDTFGHGTQVAGLVVAKGRTTGVAPGARVLPVRVILRDEYSNYSELIARGIRTAVSAGAQVISLSLAIGRDNLLIRQEVEAALKADVVVVAAAGNRSVDQGIGFPAAIPGVVAVTGLGRDGGVSSTSVAGEAAVIAAPCDDISTTSLGGTYGVGSGTSYSAAIVAGAVALVRSKFPKLKGPEVVRRLTATAIDKGPPGRDSQYGYGILNIVGALTADLPQDTSPPTAALTSSPAGPLGGGGGGGGFPWWLVAVPVVIVGGAAAFFFMRRKTREE
ncbi:hypothetical protein Rhe02_64130 [Rhizocola hellebori]|uniref:Peptidase S8/S53 domain-containing protein n=1 Tax=Rhizocola hellebori TaxID=1392758 RepID=A0A8J3QFK9_9ACTN|nr:S8 family serine peptidase [Rhizocola hellebori]GIH08346.1 hypothetical protein Rhe02_64130 [Rhizocola hellebori]